MPGRLFLTSPVSAVSEWLSATAPAGVEPSRRNISPGEDILVCIPERRLVRMRWGIIPVGRVNARGRPVLETIINARSETLFEKSVFRGVGRAVVPVDGWYEWTGEPRRKQPWRIKAADGALLAFAAITDRWVGPGGRAVDQVATVTTEPNEDLRPIHHRMAVILDDAGIEAWLRGTEAEARLLCKPWPERRLVIEKAEDMDWSAS